MSNRHDPCERCGQEAYYEGHASWCVTMSELEDKIQGLIDQVEALEKSYKNHTHTTWLDKSDAPNEI